MDDYLKVARSQLRLCEMALAAYREMLEKRPVGMLLRRNQIAHADALLVLVDELREIANHDPLNWWTQEGDVPF